MRTIILTLSFLIFSSVAHSGPGWVGYQTPVNVRINDIFFINENTGWAVCDSGKILKTVDGGYNWINHNSGVNYSLWSVSFINETTGWIAGGSRNLFALNFFRLFGTTEGGTTWNSLYYGIADQSYLKKTYLKSPTLGFLLGDGGNGGGTQGFLYKSTNFGSNWTSSLSQTHNYWDIKFKDNNTGWLITKYADDTDHDTATVMKTTNAGLNWDRIYFRNRLNLYSIHYIGNDNIVIYGQSFMTGMQGRFLLKSSNGGQSWDSTYGPAGGNYWESHFINFDTGWVVGSSGIYITTSGGTNFSQQLNSPANSVQFINSLTGWAAGNNGIVYKTVTGGVTNISAIGNTTPESFKLHQNYPNPFNPSTKIKFDIPKSWNVKISIYDNTGRLIEKLVEQNLSPGTYEVLWFAESYASGVYFYSLEAEGFKETMKMLLIK